MLSLLTIVGCSIEKSIKCIVIKDEITFVHFIEKFTYSNNITSMYGIAVHANSVLLYYGMSLCQQNLRTEE